MIWQEDGLKVYFDVSENWLYADNEKKIMKIWNSYVDLDFLEFVLGFHGFRITF